LWYSGGDRFLKNAIDDFMLNADTTPTRLDYYHVTLSTNTLLAMDYTKIGKETKKYIRKSTYIAMDKDERKLYLKSVGELVRKLDELECDTSSSSRKEVVKSSYRKLNSRRITFVGMRFHGGHRFSMDDKVKLEKEDDNPKNSNAVKVMLKEGKKWKHVAYVASEDAEWLRAVGDFEELPLEWMKDARASCTYSIDLRPLEAKGIRIKTKKDVLDRTGKFWEGGKWYDYEELVQLV
jgi:hypothetical protein